MFNILMTEKDREGEQSQSDDFAKHKDTYL